MGSVGRVRNKNRGNSIKEEDSYEEESLEAYDVQIIYFRRTPLVSAVNVQPSEELSNYTKVWGKLK